MNIGDYFKQNKKFVILGSLLVIVLIFIGILQNNSEKKGEKVIPTPMSRITTIATPSATLTPSATTSAKITPASCHATLATSDTQSVLPDPNCTPGATNPAVTQSTIRTTICTVGYTTTVRDQKSSSYYEALKKDGIKNYGYTDTVVTHYEEDHLIPLELGGSNDMGNLWPEFDNGVIPNKKDKVETYLHQQVCLGNITLSTAQEDVRTNWYSVFLTLK